MGIATQLLPAAFALACLTSEAVTAPYTPHKYGAPVSAVEESKLAEHGIYTNSTGQIVHQPAHTLGSKAPPGASARCRDGTYSFSRSRRGTCSRHGGVAQWR